MKPKTAIASTIKSMVVMLNYLKSSTGGWEPKMYSHFVELVDNNILKLRKIIQELEPQDNSGKELLELAVLTLQDYTELQEVYYS
jgi:hypothetical protein